MIQANELRIGNWVNLIAIDQKVQIESISKIESGGLFTWIENNEEYEDSLSAVDTIPLTPEILKKCGFTVNEENTEYGVGMPFGSGTDLIIEDVFSIFDLPLDVCLTTDKRNAVPKNFVYLKPIKYLHQLQNLYFTLTGEELTINL